MTGSRARFALTEYGAAVDLCKSISLAAGIDRARAGQLLVDAGNRIGSTLGLQANPITIDSRGVRAAGFAGLIRLGPSLELEIAPKFLGEVEKEGAWREDFFYLATLSRHGRLLESERLTASGGAPKDLSTLVARALTGMYATRKRRPLRSYRRVVEADFFINGDFDPVELFFPGPDGFEQEIVRFDRQNQWNGAIQAAAAALLPEISDPSAAGGLVRLIEDLSPQVWRRSPNRKRIPARHGNWKPLHDLALDVLNGLGVNYKQGSAHAPGYVVSTWQVWEDLLTIGARLGFGKEAVSPQKGFVLGSRGKSADDGKFTPLSVFPDCVIENRGSRPRVLLDAKYKGHVEKGTTRISEADIYEALAFARAAGCEVVILAYPVLSICPQVTVGSCSGFEQIKVGSIKVIGVQIEARGIATSGALQLFAATMADHLTKIIA
jgi:5-methylcytosine-specific restriction enzyme subunit McrC